MAQTSRDVLSSARGSGGSRKHINGSGPSPGSSSAHFINLVENTSNSFAARDDAHVEDVRRTLEHVRKQYDTVHHECQTKEAQLQQTRDKIRALVTAHEQTNERKNKQEDLAAALEEQYQEIQRKIFETKTSQKVFTHMLTRIQKEQAIMKEKMLKMEDHVARKKREAHQKTSETERVRTDRVSARRELTILQDDSRHEREACRRAREEMEGEVRNKKEASQLRGEFQSWHLDVRLDAANKAFNASAGRLRKLYAIEKLAGNSLQKMTLEQMVTSQATEDGFAQIRKVTGLSDVMDIVHKFLHRDLEQEQLKASAKFAEARRDMAQQEYDAFKRDTEGIIFDKTATHKDGDLYKEIEKTESSLTQAMEEHEHSRMKLQKANLQVEHMKRWSHRVGNMLAAYEDPVKVEKVENVGDLPAFFKRMDNAVRRFVETVAHQISEGTLTRHTLAADVSNERERQKHFLTDKEIQHNNCRVQHPMDSGRELPSVVEEDPAMLQEERSRCKKESEERVEKARQAQAGMRGDKDKKKRKG